MGIFGIIGDFVLTVWANASRGPNPLGALLVVGAVVWLFVVTH